MATITTEERKAQLVITYGLDGSVLDMVASYYEVGLNEDGSINFADVARSTTWTKAQEDFPLEDFMSEATQRALLKAEATDQLQAELDQALVAVKTRESEVEKHKATIAGWEQVSSVISQNMVNVANAAVNDVNALKAKES